MRHLQLVIFFYIIISSLKAQTADAIIQELQSINKKVSSKNSNTNGSAAISNRAMNIFMADKTGYLSESTDLSLYTNYVTLNTSEGKITINHNFQKVTGIDEPIKKLLSVGINMNIANSFATTFSDKKVENELGITVSYKWLGKVKTRFSDFELLPGKPGQQQAMDALRAGLLQSLIVEIKNKEANFGIAMQAIDTTDIPGQNTDTAKAIILRNFYENIKAEYEKKFAVLQAELLSETNNFKRISTSWTSITSYIPVASPTYTVAPSLTAAFSNKHAYPMNITLSHTRLWESSKTGRWFVTLGSTIFLNNSKLSYALSGISASDYRNLGGTDTTHLTELNTNKVYIGQYHTFITPSLSGRLVYFPPASHVGISLSAAQNFGSYHLLNGKLGIPIILINSKKLPAADFELNVLFYDISDKTYLVRRYGNKTVIGLSVGIPFSRLMY